MGMEFDGSGDRVSLGTTIDLFTNWAVAYWYYQDTTSRMLLGTYNENGNRFYHCDSSTYYVTFNDVGSVALSYTESLGSRHHIVVTNDDSGSNNIKLYKDGTFVSQGTKANPDVRVNSIGQAHNSASYDWDGLLDDTRIYNKDLSPAEIQSIYHSRGADNIVNGLVGRWLMNEKPDGSTASGASSVIDISKEGNHGTPANSPVYRASPLKLVGPIHIE